MVSPETTLFTERADCGTVRTTDSIDTSAQRSGEPSSIRQGGPPPRLDGLTSLRFFAAAMLVLFHADLFLNHPPLFAGIALKQGVCFFFVLSGFILFYNYPSLNNVTERAKFFIARFARIWPAQTLVLIVALALLPSWSLGAHGPKLVGMVASELFMVQSYIPDWRYYLALNSPAWSISTEFFFYAAFPFLIFNWSKTWIPKLCVAALLTALSISGAHYVSTLPFTYDHKQLTNYLVYINPAARMLEFVLGMCTAYAFKNVRSSFASNTKAIAAIQAGSVMLVALALVTTPFSPQELSKPIPSALASWIDGSGGCIAFACLIFSMAFSQGFVSRALSHPFLVLLGEISYSIYLLHWILLVMLRMYLNTGNLYVPRWEYLTSFAVVLGLCSYSIYRFVEKPCRRYLTRSLDGLWDKYVEPGLLQKQRES
jgi:peptidoglycan/LPS O-acetylase OafA/YrhL